jgi:hypothetical protein
MDLLEALVLHGQIVVDKGSRSSDLWPSLPWLGVGELRQDAPGVPPVLAEHDLVQDLTHSRLRHSVADDGGSTEAGPEIVSSLILA